MDEALAENKFPEILVRCEQDCLGLTTPQENRLIVDAGIKLGNIENIVPVGSETVDNLLVNTFVRDDLHPATFSTG